MKVLDIVCVCMPSLRMDQGSPEKRNTPRSRVLRPLLYRSTCIDSPGLELLADFFSGLSSPGLPIIAFSHSMAHVDTRPSSAFHKNVYTYIHNYAHARSIIK